MTYEATPPPGARSRADLLDAFLDELADRLAPRVVALMPEAAPRYATAKHNPIGTTRGFSDAARAHRFPTFKRGREVCALWADVEKWIESRKRSPRARQVEPVDDDRALLDAAGIRPRAARKGAR